MGRAIEILEKHLNIAYNQTIGYLTGIPDSLGTGLRSSVHLKVDNLEY